MLGEWFNKLFGKDEPRPEPSSPTLEAILLAAKLEKKRLKHKDSPEPKPKRAKK